MFALLSKLEDWELLRLWGFMCFTPKFTISYFLLKLCIVLNYILVYTVSCTNSDRFHMIRYEHFLHLFFPSLSHPPIINICVLNIKPSNTSIFFLAFAKHWFYDYERNECAALFFILYLHPLAKSNTSWSYQLSCYKSNTLNFPIRDPI